MSTDWFLVLWDTEFDGTCWNGFAHRTAGQIPPSQIKGFKSFLASTIAHPQIEVLMVTKKELVQLMMVDGKKGIFRRSDRAMTWGKIRQIIEIGADMDALNRSDEGNWEDQQWFIRFIEAMHG